MPIQWNNETYYRAREVAVILGKSIRQASEDMRLGRIPARLICGVRHVAAADLDAVFGAVETPATRLRSHGAARRDGERALEELRARGYRV